MILELFEKVSHSSLWAFTLTENNFTDTYKTIHFPLIYGTKSYIELELYAKSLIKFIDFNTDLVKPEISIIDDCVVKFNSLQFERFKTNLLTYSLSNIDFGKKIAENSLVIQKTFPELCIWLESKFNNRPNNYINLIQLIYKLLIELIAINQFNPIFETAYLYLNIKFSKDKYFNKLQQKYLYKKSFSHISLFKSSIDNLIQNKNLSKDLDNLLIDFYWNVSFLQDKIEKINNKSEVFFINENINNKKSLKFYTNKNNLPKKPPIIQFDPSKITNSLPNFDDNINYIFYMIKILEVNEEFRHYWQARFIRLLRLLQKKQEIIEKESFEMLLTKL